MPQTFANTISLDGGTTNLPIYADRAEKDAAGNDIQTTYATKSEIVNADWDAVSGTPGYIENKPVIPEGVPTYTAAEEGKVLGVVEVSGSPALDWVALSGSSDIFYATYASTTFNEIQSAVNDGKYVILSRQGSLLPLTAIVGSSHFAKAYFQSISNPYNNESHNSLRLTTYICSYNNQWTFFNTFVPPASSASDAGKVLTVSSSGNAEWATPSGGGSVTDVEVNGTSVVNASGVAEVTVPAQVNADWNAVSGAAEILNKPTIPSGSDLVPPYSIPADEGKVLTIGPSTTYWATPAAGGVTDVEVDGTSVVSGGVASITMPTVDQTYDATSTNAQSGVAVANAIASAGLFQATYGVTTYAEIDAAYQAHKIVYCYKAGGAGINGGRLAFLAYANPGYNYEFQYYRSDNNGGDDSVFIYKVSSSNVWSETNRNVQKPADWDAVSGPTSILNKPTIPAAQVNADWNASSGVAEILNKPTIPAAQVNSDWNASSGVAEILNKPTILPYKQVVAGTGVRIVDDTANNRIVVEADETVLYENNNPSQIISETTLSLSESYLNFERVKVYLRASGGNTAQGNYVVEAQVYQGEDTEVSAVAVVNAIGSIMYDMNVFLFSTSSPNICTAKTNGTRLNIATSGISSTANRGARLYKIVGINRIASN